ncbi:tyrosine-protein phosphatase [Actinocorallia populi]|uniref:tyrosine-protein phosphatase n=1 Tax=Actinocorallia populi TaxID=2079200 RepID=UPI0013002F81|nr:tyrosine-protein phosphatase [Actinocorallia populi]
MNPPTSVPRRAGFTALGAIIAFGAVQPAASAHPNNGPRITQVTVTRTADGTHNLTWTARKPGKTYVYASTDSRDPSRSGHLVAQTTSSGTDVPNLEPGRRWYFEIAPKRSANARGPITATRQIALDGPHNTRDLGGYPTKDNRTIRWGLIYRSDDLSEATETDKAHLTSLGVTTSVDFRGPAEIAKSGPNRLPEGVKTVAIPLLDESGNALAAALTAALASGDASVLEEMLGNGKARQIVLDSYRGLASSKEVQAGFRDVLLRLADETQTPLVYNCTSGKDRTGVMSAVILTLLRVPHQTITDDFTLSNTHLAASHQRTYALLESKGIDSDLVRPLLEQHPDYLNAFFEGINTEYGSFNHYLHNTLNLNQKTITHLRHTLTTP